MSRTQKRFVSRTLFYLLLLVIFVYIVFPFYWTVRSSITPNSELFLTPVHYWPENPTLQNYQLVLSDNTFVKALFNSAIVAVSVTLLSLVIGVLGSYALGRFKFQGRMPIMYLILSMTMFPQIAVLGALFQRVTQFGLYNTLTALILTYLIFTLPFTVWVLTTFMRELPKELEEAAILDDASLWIIITRVFMPLMWPALVTTGLLAFIAAWNEFLFALTFTLTNDERTVPVGIAVMSGASAHELPWGNIMAASVIVTLPLVILVLAFQRRIVSGLTAGAVKG